MDPDSEFVPDATQNHASVASSSFPSTSSAVMQSLFSELDHHMLKMDCFLQLENEKLRNRVSFEELQQRQGIMQRFVSNINQMMLQRDEELSAARNRAKELEDLLQAASNHVQLWKGKVEQKEAVLNDLRNKLGGTAQTASLGDSTSGEETIDTTCKSCRILQSSFVFLPCKHLCCCVICESLHQQCPVCETEKQESVEAYLSSEWEPEE